MSWEVLQPIRRAAGGRDIHPVTIAVSKSGRMQQRIYVTVQPGTPGLDWWKFKAPVTVAVGKAEHSGRVRISAGGQLSIMAPTGRGKGTAPILQAPVPDLPATGLRQRPVPWEVLGAALIITLPWGGATGMVKAMNSSAPPPMPARSLPPGVEPVPATAAAAAPAAAPPSAPAAPEQALVKPVPPPVPARAPAPATEAPLVSNKPPLAMTHAEIERWAIENGVGSATHGFVLDEVNQKRLKFGRRPFVIRKTAKS